MCQYNNVLKNTGDNEKIVFKLLLLGPKANSWVTPFVRKELITGVRYDGGEIDIHYSKKMKKIGKGYFHCYETYEDAFNERQRLFLGPMYFIVKCVIPENTAYYEGYYHFGYDPYVETAVKTIATRSIIVDEMMIDL